MKACRIIVLTAILISAPSFADDLANKSTICDNAAVTAKIVAGYTPGIIASGESELEYIKDYRRTNAKNNRKSKLSPKLNAYMIMAGRSGVFVGWDAGSNGMAKNIVYSLVYSDCMHRPMVWILGAPTLANLLKRRE
jgi:hypothetical protein